MPLSIVNPPHLHTWQNPKHQEPTTIVGAVVGSFANKVLPALVVSVLLVLVLSALAHRTLKKVCRPHTLTDNQSICLSHLN
jgi:uncharacterized membrane protein YfcA